MSLGDPVPWSQAWANASAAFWERQEPQAHFRTSAGPLVADRIAELVQEVADRLDAGGDLQVVDLGAGDASLLTEVRDRCAHLGGPVRWVAVDVRASQQPGIDVIIERLPAALPGAPFRGLVMAHEWLDEIPCDVVERDEDCVDRLVLVDAAGVECLGPSIDDDRACAQLGVDAPRARAWLARWWPLAEPGDRAEVGHPRDAAWAWMTGLVAEGTALACDYGHVGTGRGSTYPRGTLTAFCEGRIVDAVPDGRVGITAHVALDACQARVPGTCITRQRDELPPGRLAQDPTLDDIERYFAAQRVRDPAGLGSIAWMRWER